jgi:hypothetical protein
MKIRTIMVTAGVLALGLASTPGQAQGPLYDRVNVSLPYSVSVGGRTLQPGDYVIQQLRDNGGGSRVLLIYSDNGMKFETSAMTIPALQGTSVTPEKTSVVLHHLGNDYYFDKVWIQGKDYGYEFPLPDAVKSRQKERAEPISVAATYSTTQQNTTTAAATTPSTATAAPATTTAQATTQPATTQPQTTTAPATTPSTATAQPSTMQPSTTQSATTTRSTMAPATTVATNTSADRAMPATSAGWLMMLLSGGALSSVGFALRRKQ